MYAFIYENVYYAINTNTVTHIKLKEIFNNGEIFWRLNVWFIDGRVQDYNFDDGEVARIHFDTIINNLPIEGTP